MTLSIVIFSEWEGRLVVIWYSPQTRSAAATETQPAHNMVRTRYNPGKISCKKRKVELW